MQNLFLSGTARGKSRSFPTLTHRQTISSHLQLILVKAHFKINLASFPHSGRQISLRFFFPFKKRTLKAAACEKQSGQPLLPSKIIGCSQDYRKKKSGHICCSASCQETILPPLWSDFTPRSFFARASFLVLFQITAPHIRLGKITPGLIVRISAWRGRCCLRRHPPG